MSADQVSEKTLELTQVFGSYVFDHPDFLEKLPDRATLVFLDPDDPWFNEEAKRIAERNQRLTRQSGEEPGPLVYITVKLVQEAVVVPKLEVSPPSRKGQCRDRRSARLSATINAALVL